MPSELLYGLNTVLALILTNAGKRSVYEIIINSGRSQTPKLQQILIEAKSRNITTRFLQQERYNDFLKNDPSFSSDDFLSGDQGVLARVSKYNYRDLIEDIERGIDKESLFVILDGITDVGNFGSILRNCSAFGVNGVMIPKNRSVEAGSRASKISSGAMEESKIYCVTNLVQAIKTLKENGFWIYGTTLDKEGDIRSAESLEYMLPAAIVFGSESKGMGKLVSQNCDFLITVEMHGKMDSLNVSTSTGIFLYIIRHQLEFHKTTKDR